MNFACYYSMPKNRNVEAYTRLQKYILQYLTVVSEREDFVWGFEGCRASRLFTAYVNYVVSV